MDPVDEGEFERLSDMVDRYSARRNDIAHGIAHRFKWIITPMFWPVTAIWRKGFRQRLVQWQVTSSWAS